MYHVSLLWTAEQLEIIADARRVLGYADTFVNFRALANKFIQASTFEEAMELRPKDSTSAVPASAEM